MYDGLRWGMSIWILVITVSVYHQSSASESSDLSVSQIQATGKVLFRALRNSECKVDCSNKKRRLVCGSDGVTYHSRCHVKKAKRCEGRRVKVRRKGRCSGSTGCTIERENAQAVARKPTVGVFIPECKKDGSYAEIQCHAATGYCWCASKDGKPVPGTSKTGTRPICKGKPRRRKNKAKGKRKRKRICRTSDRIEFNKHLVKVFTEEYNRMMATSGSSRNSATSNGGKNDPRLTSLEKRVVLWKFSELDRNKDNKLRRREVRNLKRVVKKLIKPRACAKNFVKYCDLDANKRIERREWTLCLGKDISSLESTSPKTNISFRLFISLNSEEQTTAAPQEQPVYTDEDSLIKLIGPRPPTIWSSPRLDPQSSESQPPVNDGNEDRIKSCSEERNAALRQQQDDPNGKTFIPKCTPDGQWVKAQCHEPSQYCWCVVPESGAPVSGTATQHAEPNCDLERERTMKGCPLTTKRQFLLDMIEAFIHQMNTQPNGTSQNNMPLNGETQSREEKANSAIRWKFRLLDKSGNSILERKELKHFRKNIPKKKDTRKCSRNFIRYCDENGDRKVTLDEWLECTSINYNALNLPKRGRNPFSGILNPS